MEFIEESEECSFQWIQISNSIKIISTGLTNNNNNNYELYFEPIKGGNTMGPPYIRPCFTDNEFNLASWGTIEIWPQKQAQVKALIKSKSNRLLDQTNYLGVICLPDTQPNTNIEVSFKYCFYPFDKFFWSEFWFEWYQASVMEQLQTSKAGHCTAVLHIFVK